MYVIFYIKLIIFNLMGFSKALPNGGLSRQIECAAISTHAGVTGMAKINLASAPA
jgi:hypothetical protein